MRDRLEDLFEAVRGACSTAAWSRGVELTRARAVLAERIDDDEAVFLISLRGGMISRTVSLYLEDSEWDCGCESHAEACEHVAAAVIGLRRSREAGVELPRRGEEQGRVGYRFRRSAQGLVLEREIVQTDASYPLETTLAAVASGRVEGPAFVAAQADLAAELALGTHRRGVLSPRLLPKLFAALSHCTDVTLDGRAVTVSAEPVLPHARLDEQGDGFRLSIEEDRSVSELFGNGVALCGERLRPVGDSRLTGRELHELPGGRHYGPDEVAELVTSVLPSLRRRIPVEVNTERLPHTRVGRPRVAIRTDRSGEVLSVLAALLYGDPPRARVDGGRLVHLQGDVPLRDERAERVLVRRLQRELHLAPGVRAEFVGEQAVAFAARLAGWEQEVQGTGHRDFRMAAPLVPDLRVEGELFEVRFDSRGAGSESHGSADPAAVVGAWREGRSLVPLSGGGWAPLPRDWLERFGNRVADLLAAREPDGKLPRCVWPDLARLCDEMDRPPPPELAGLKHLLDGFEGVERSSLPDDLTAELRGYQREGVDWLRFLQHAGLGALLADDMGLGKTLQALCALSGRTLVVAPTSVLHNWVDEARRFRPALTCSVYHGPKRELDPAADVTLTTYAILRLDTERLAGERWETVILDEAQAIKNPDSRVAAAAFRLQASHRIVLTGTPVENRLEELWSQFHFINRGLLGGRRDFQERYAVPIADGEPGAAARLRDRTAPFILRRLKQEVAPELPPRTEMVLHCELVPEERDVYDAIRVATLDDVVGRLESGGGVLAALEALLRLRQAACHAALIPGQEAAGSSKLRLLLEVLESVVAEDHKALVFSQWTSLLDLTEPHLRDAGIDFVRLDGSTRDRGAVVSRFQDDSGPPVILISLKAGGTGLNLTAADHVFLLDPWWNPAVEAQAADRAHRIGQERPVMIYRLVAEETVEERILLLQQRKREIAEAALAGTDRAAALTREDLLELLS